MLVLRSPSISQMVEYFEDYMNYKLEETKVGTWINGKPIYRRIFVGENNFGTNNTVTLADCNDWNVDEWIKIEGHAGVIGTTGMSACRDLLYYTMLTSATQTKIGYFGVNVNTGILQIGNYNAHNLYYRIFIEYTKTTD